MGLNDKIENAGQDVKGRLKEAAGAVSGDEQIKSEGKLDQAAAAAKDTVESAKDKAADVLDAVKDKLKK